jgi:SAM-dependent methyltransferase
MNLISWLLGQCRQPRGRLGRFLAREMNRAHAPMTAWILSHLPERGVRRTLDLGCGGGGAMRKLASLLPDAELHGIDHSVESLRVASGVNRDLIGQGRVFVRHGTVSDLPYEAGHFDLVLAIESHYFWPDLPSDLAEVRRVLAPGGKLILGGGVYLGGRHDARNRRLAEAGGMNCLGLSQFERILAAAGFIDVVAHENRRKGWFCVAGATPSPLESS